MDAPFAPPPAAPAPASSLPEDGYATASLLAAIVGLVVLPVAPVLGLAAITLGLVARGRGRGAPHARARTLAALGIALGALSIVVFGAAAGVLAAWLRAHPGATDAPVAGPGVTAVVPRSMPPAPAPAASAEDEPDDAESAPGGETRVAIVGKLTIVDLALGATPLAQQLREQMDAAHAAGERVLLQTTGPRCEPCAGVAKALPDPLMQRALARTRLVRVDVVAYQRALVAMRIPIDVIPGFFLLDDKLRIVDGINGGEWGDDVAENIAPVLGPFLRGAYPTRKHPWSPSREAPGSGGTTL